VVGGRVAVILENISINQKQTMYNRGMAILAANGMQEMTMSNSENRDLFKKRRKCLYYLVRI
jgi:hypothetical protein